MAGERGIGLGVCRRFHAEVIAPIVAAAAPGLRHDAALVGAGSEVLGFDDATSTDHDWAPRAQVVVADGTDPGTVTALRRALDEQLPDRFEGYPVRIEPTDPGAGADRPVASTPGQGGHRVVVTTARELALATVGRDPRDGMSVVDWLVTPQQRLAELTAGEVFRDDGCGLADNRRRVAWYPDDVWRYLLACQWQRVAQLEPFVGRTGDAGDDLGSRLVTASLVRDAMRLAFLVSRRYAPYAKWFGTAFARLPLADTVGPDLAAALGANDWPEREAAIVRANLALVDATNALGLAPRVDAAARPFYDRPYRIVGAEAVRDALAASIRDPEVLAVIERAGWVGAADQASDSVDLLTRPGRLARLAGLYGSGERGD